jgi:hypothetical protein
LDALVFIRSTGEYTAAGLATELSATRFQVRIFGTDDVDR